MRNRIGSKVFMFLLAAAVLTVPQMSYAQMGISVGFGPGWQHNANFVYRWHDQPHWGWRVHDLPSGYLPVWVGRTKYYYYDGLYYTGVGGGAYVLVAPPVGAYVSVLPPEFHPVIVRGRTYYSSNGIYYVVTRHRGYKVVRAPVWR